MIVPITSNRGKTIGTASVERVGDDVSVEFYIRKGYELSPEVMDTLVKELKSFANDTWKKYGDANRAK